MPAPLRPQTPSRDVGDCPSGFRFHSCVLNAFRGCCSIDPCARGFTCPDSNQPQSSSTTSPTSPSSTASSETMASPDSISPTPGPTIISSVGPALGNGQAGLATASFPLTQSSFITNLPTSPTTTFGVRPSSTAASSSLAPSSLAPSPSPITSTNANNGNGSSDSQSYPIGLIAGVVTGFSILMLVMGVLFVVLWRNKRSKGSRDSEASQMRGPRAAIPFYYVPPPTQDERQQQQQNKGTESGASTPVRSARFPPELEVMTPPPRMEKPSPRRSRILFNKAWPAAPRSAQGLPQTPASSQPAPQEDASTPSLAFPGHAMNHPDPLRADGLVSPPTGARAVHFTPVKANLVHNHPPSSSSSSHSSPAGGVEDQQPRRDSTGISPSSSSTIPGSIATAASNRNIITTADYEQTLRRHLQRYSGLTRSDSTAAHALSPPPRRPKTGDSEAEGAMSEGKLDGQPGLRLSGVDQGPSGEGPRESLSGDETDPRATWHGHGEARAGNDNVTTPMPESRRYSK